MQASFPEKKTAQAPRAPAPGVLNDYLLAAPLEVSVPLAPPEVPELEPPLGALELALLSELGELGAVPPVLLEPYCFTQSSRSVPLMPAHWLGMLDGSLMLGEVELEPLLGLLDVLGALLAPDEPPLVDCAHAALASNAAATAAATVWNFIASLLG